MTGRSGVGSVSEILIAAAILAGYLVVYLLLKRRLSRLLDPAAVLGEIRGEVDRIIVELNQTTDRNISLIEDRIGRVSELLEQADRKIGLLRRESEKHEVAARVYSELGRGRPPAGQSESPGPAPDSPERDEGAEAGRAEAGRAEALRAEARGRVVALSEQGISPTMIARQLNMPLGEIELVLSLAGKSRSS